VKGGFTLENWYRAIREGEVFVTNGPMLFFGKKGEGTLWVEAAAREPIDRVELVANGRVIHRFPGAEGKIEFKGEFTIDQKDYSWAAARCFVKVENTIRLAHSAPVYLPGKFDAREDARYFVRWIDDLTMEGEKDPKRFPNKAEDEEIMNLYGKAQAIYRAKLR